MGEMISHLSNAGVSVPRFCNKSLMPIVSSASKAVLTLEFKQNLVELNVDDVNALAETGAKFVNGLYDPTSHLV